MTSLPVAVAVGVGSRCLLVVHDALQLRRGADDFPAVERSHDATRDRGSRWDTSQ